MFKEVNLSKFHQAGIETVSLSVVLHPNSGHQSSLVNNALSHHVSLLTSKFTTATGASFIPLFPQMNLQTLREKNASAPTDSTCLLKNNFIQ